MSSRVFRVLKLTMLLLFISYAVGAQQKDTVKNDTARIKHGFVERMQQFAKASEKSSADDIEADKAAQKQEETLAEIKKNLQRAKIYLRTSLDSLSAKRELKLIANHTKIAGDGVFSHKESVQTFRNLVTAQKLLNTLSIRCKLQKDELDKQKRQLSNYKYQIDSLSGIKALFRFPTDSAKLRKYMESLVVMAKEVSPVDSLLNRRILQVQALQNQANLQLFELETYLDEIERYQKKMSDDFFKSEYDFIWKPNQYSNSLGKILSYSIQKTKLNLNFFTRSNIGIVFSLFLLVAVCYAFIITLKNAYVKEVGNNEIKEDQLILRYPLISAVFLIANLGQFLFSNPPFVFSLILWLTASCCLSSLMSGYISRFWMKAWLSMFLLFALACLNNLILQGSMPERWLILVLSGAGILVGCWIFKAKRQNELRESLIIYAIGLMVALETLAFVFIIFGNYNLAKALLVAGYVNVIIAILFLWTVRLINQGLQLAFILYTKQDKSLFFMNFDKVGQRAPTLLYVLLVLGWLILFGRNFPAYAFIVEPVRNFFFDQRAIGSYSFSISNLILFFFVVSTAVVVSKVVSFFAVDKRILTRQQGMTKGIGSWILLIRITIILIGLFLAFASVGIPIDKIAIVLGALGVGIGFGLQSLVNNLVSGLVIAFEKPLNLDDEVEVSGKMGTVKSIGFRSSVISTVDGAEIVMPNGDLLNSHLVNWSSGSARRRFTIAINVAHHADLKLIKEEIIAIAIADERIAKHPEPSVFFQDINADALELRLNCWTKQSKQLAEIKSDLILLINQFFLANNIPFAHPKQEVFVHDIPKDKKNLKP